MQIQYIYITLSHTYSIICNVNSLGGGADIYVIYKRVYNSGGDTERHY